MDGNSVGTGATDFIFKFIPGGGASGSAELIPLQRADWSAKARFKFGRLICNQQITRSQTA
jgi:hypothetical protein